MSIDRLDFDNLSESDLRELLELPVQEGLQIEYKRDLYGKSDEQKKELLKDISGFANAFGGHLSIGVGEEQGVPITVGGIDANPDESVRWLEQIAGSGIVPRIQGLRTKAVPLAGGKHCLVIRIPRSWHPPHQVTLNKRFWIRNSGGMHEASMDELRSLFSLGGDITQRAHRFRDERLSLISSQPNASNRNRSGRFILHIVPLSALLSSSTSVDLSRASAAALASTFRPIGGGCSPRFNLDGFICDAGEDGYTQIFRNGVIEALHPSIVKTNGDGSLPVIASSPLELAVGEALPRYVLGLRDLDVSLPLIVMLSLQGVEGARYRVEEGPELGHNNRPFDRDPVVLPHGFIGDFASDGNYNYALKPAFDALWNAAGFPQARGRWRH